MEVNEILEGNKLIAEFMNFTIWIDSGKQLGYCELDVNKFSAYKDGYGHRPHACRFEDLRFHSSWDWLMPVVEKILCCTDPEITEDQEWDYHYTQIHDALWSINIGDVWQACIEFIKWYNEKNRS